MRRLASPAQRRRLFVRWALVLGPLILLAGMISGLAAGSGADNPWFAMLTKPDLYPPPIAFPIVWSALYLVMGVALALVIAAPRSRWRTVARPAFAVQFALNLAWSPVFFAEHRISLALLIIVLLDLALIGTMVAFGKVHRMAALLLAPYLLWTMFATGLNWQLLRDNRALDGITGAKAASILIDLPS